MSGLRVTRKKEAAAGWLSIELMGKEAIPVESEFAIHCHACCGGHAVWDEGLKSQPSKAGVLR